MGSKLHEVTVEAELGDGDLPSAVRLDVTQGPHTLRTAEVDPAHPVATFEMEEGDYVAHATSLVPHGTPASAVFAVPTGVKVK